MQSNNNAKGSLSAAIRGAFINLLKEVHTTLPGEIVSFNPSTQTAEVQASIKRIYVKEQADGSEIETAINIPILINVPVMFPRGGGWCITFPVKAGDECIIFFSERAIDVWRKNGGVQSPKDWRMHDYSDAICQVGLSSAPNTIADFNQDDFQIRSESGNVKITLTNAEDITIETPNTVTVGAENLVFNATGSVVFNTPEATFNGNTTANSADIIGSIDIGGTSTASDHDSDGVSGKSHMHGGVQTGGGVTGGPI